MPYLGTHKIRKTPKVSKKLNKKFHIPTKALNLYHNKKINAMKEFYRFALLVVVVLAVIYGAKQRQKTAKLEQEIDHLKTALQICEGGIE